MWLRIIMLVFLPCYFSCAEHIQAKVSDHISKAPDVEKKILLKLKRDNPDWRCTSESFSLFSTSLGLNIMLSGLGITNLSALSEFDFDAIILRNTSVCNTLFLHNSKSLRVFAMLNDENNFRQVDLSSLQGKKLKSLFLSNVRVANDSCIKDIRFRILSMNRVANVNFSNFTGLCDLRSFTAINMEVCEIDFLYKCPRLEFLRLDDMSNWRPSQVKKRSGGVLKSL